MDDTTWIVIANASRARVFLQEKPDRLVELDDMVNPKARLRNAELEHGQIDPISASKSRHGTAAPTQPNGYQPNQPPEEHQTELFARDLADLLLTGLHEGRYRRLMLSASPKFLGVLRQVIDPRVKAAVGLEIDQDYTHCKAHELPQKLAVHTARG